MEEATLSKGSSCLLGSPDGVNEGFSHDRAVESAACIQAARCKGQDGPSLPARGHAGVAMT